MKTNGPQELPSSSWGLQSSWKSNKRHVFLLVSLRVPFMLCSCYFYFLSLLCSFIACLVTWICLSFNSCRLHICLAETGKACKCNATCVYSVKCCVWGDSAVVHALSWFFLHMFCGFARFGPSPFLLPATSVYHASLSISSRFLKPSCNEPLAYVVRKTFMWNPAWGPN